MRCDVWSYFEARLQYFRAFIDCRQNYKHCDVICSVWFGLPPAGVERQEELSADRDRSPIWEPRVDSLAFLIFPIFFRSPDYSLFIQIGRQSLSPVRNIAFRKKKYDYNNLYLHGHINIQLNDAACNITLNTYVTRHDIIQYRRVGRSTCSDIREPNIMSSSWFWKCFFLHFHIKYNVFDDFCEKELYFQRGSLFYFLIWDLFFRTLCISYE